MDTAEIKKNIQVSRVVVAHDKVGKIVAYDLKSVGIEWEEEEVSTQVFFLADFIEVVCNGSLVILPQAAEFETAKISISDVKNRIIAEAVQRALIMPTPEQVVSRMRVPLGVAQTAIKQASSFLDKAFKKVNK